jgi:signal transduction histidine kinase
MLPNSEFVDALPTLASILHTDELNLRPFRPPDYQAENHALVELIGALADAPDAILQTLTDTILKVLHCDSAGISLLSEDGRRFYWPAIAGVWKPHIGGGTPRDFGPCGDVLDLNSPQLFKHVERRYAYFQPVTPPVEECLLVPFYVNGKAVGTIWAIAHSVGRKFDREDLRMLESLGRFAAAVFHSVKQLQSLNEQSDERDAADRQLRAVNEALLISGIRQEELADTSESLNDRLQAAIEEKEYFIAVLSHELRTPLTPVLLAASMHQHDQGLEPGMLETMQMIHRNITLEARLIDDLLDMTRMERGKLRLDRCAVDLRGVLERAVEESRVDLESSELTLVVNVGVVAQFVDADPSRLQQVFSNLLRNAIKFTPAGGSIKVRCRRDAGSCVVEFTDSGIGLDPEFIPNAFNAFEQGDKTGARRAGLGLGLAICKTIVDLHGGIITADSEGKDRGTTFTITLPAVIGAQSAPADAIPAALKARLPIKPLRILLVEDHADTARAMRHLLKADGHAVQWAADVAGGLKLAAAHKFDLLLSDLGLPDGTGVDLMRALRREGSTLPGIVLSGYGQEQDLARSEEAGFAAHLVKPLSAQLLREAIDAIHA